MNTTEAVRPKPFYDGPSPIDRPAKHQTAEAVEALSGDLAITLSPDNWAMAAGFLMSSADEIRFHAPELAQQIADVAEYIGRTTHEHLGDLDIPDEAL